MSRVDIADEATVRSKYASAARRCRVVAFSGLPATGKSFHVKEFAHAAHAAGRSIHLLQYDIARERFETAETLARYPLVDGVTHAMIRRAVGSWVRTSLAAWHRTAPADAIVVAEVPLIGNRLIELVQPIDDDCEALLASEDTFTFVPVPTERLRAHIESSRARTVAEPAHEREARDALPTVVEASWRDLREAGVELGVLDATRSTPAYSATEYATVYSHLLRYRHHDVLLIDDVFASEGSVYDLAVDVTELEASPAEVADTFRSLEAVGVGEVESLVDRWFDF